MGLHGERDVWSHAGGRYRVRAVVLLLVNLLLFCGVGVFAYWIRSGVVFAPAMEGYADQILGAFRFGPGTGATLGSLLLEPISVLRVPMQIGVLGLLMAALISIPILVSILYRFWCSLPFIVVVGLVAVMPWLALTLLGSCVIASVRPLRSKYHFMSALFGLVPAVVYLVMAWSDSRSSFAGDYDPVDGIKFVAPWVLAIVAAGAVFAVVLSIARLAGYRPGAITPLLTVMFALPLVLFERYVGRDELSYRLLLALDRAYFADVDASLDLRAALDTMRRQAPAGGEDARRIEEQTAQRWLFGLSGQLDDSMHSVLTRRQWEMGARCDRFLRDYPASRHAADVLFLKARALDQRIDEREFRRNNWIRCFSDFPSPASRGTWQLLAEHQPGTPLGACAEARLAWFDLRGGQVDRALGRLRGAEKVLSEFLTKAAPVSAAPGSSEDELGISWLRRRAAARRWIELLESNHDPVYGYDPISGSRRASTESIGGWAHFHPRDDRYRRNLEGLRRSFPRSRLEDNLDLETALLIDDPETRIRALEQVLTAHPEGDAQPETLYRLAEAARAAARPEDAARMTVKLIVEFPQSYWAEQARGEALPWYVLAVGGKTR